MWSRLCTFLALAAGASALIDAPSDRPITKVVKLLQEMLEKAKAEGDSEEFLFAKHDCYCKTTEAQKSQEIDTLTQEIGLLEGAIEQLKASSGKLSVEVGQLKQDMDENIASRNTATAIRTKENTDFLATQADLVDAISQTGDAIQVLSDIGADQTLGAARDHDKYMSDYAEKAAALTSIKSTVKKAMLAALAFSSDKQAKSLDAFIQAPFTGTYSARSGEVVGILKDMRDTFSANLKSARESEAKAAAAHTAYMASMLESFNTMENSYTSKLGQLSSNDDMLSGKNAELADAEKLLSETQAFKAQLLQMCADKKTQYNERVALRTQEMAALSEAIAILNSDAAFESFGKVGSTSAVGEAFVQIRRHRIRALADRTRSSSGLQKESDRARAIHFLEKTGKSDPMLGKIISMLQANNPFKVVLEEIEKMISLIEKEEKADDEQKDWCVTERTNTNADIGVKSSQLITLDGAISQLVNEIEDPEIGLKANIALTEEMLSENVHDQTEDTKNRKSENEEYQKNIANIKEAEALLDRAITVLIKYYSKISTIPEVLLQHGDAPTTPAPPATWEDEYKGQSGGNFAAVSMLRNILADTQQEEKDSHSFEASSQHSFEDNMIFLKAEEKSMQASLASLQVTLANKEKTLMEKREDFEKTTNEKVALENYLEKIKPGCDFIMSNIETRKSSRAQEKTALNDAVTFLKGTPAYTEAMEAAHQESLGECQEKCSESEDEVKCKACLAGTSIPGYCAGHPTTQGCGSE